MSWIIEYLAGSVGGRRIKPTKDVSEKLERLTTILADVAPEIRDQWGSVIKDAVDVRGPGVDRSTEQVHIGRLAVDSLTVTLDGEERLGRHRRARGEGDGWVDNRDRPGLGMM